MRYASLLQKIASFERVQSGANKEVLILGNTGYLARLKTMNVQVVHLGSRPDVNLMYRIANNSLHPGSLSACPSSKSFLERDRFRK